jgi:hypothetical protein
MILRSAFLDPNHSTTLVLCCTAAECFSSPALPQRDFAAGAHFAQPYRRELRRAKSRGRTSKKRKASKIHTIMQRGHSVLSHAPTNAGGPCHSTLL